MVLHVIVASIPLMLGNPYIVPSNGKSSVSSQLICVTSAGTLMSLRFTSPDASVMLSLKSSQISNVKQPVAPSQPRPISMRFKNPKRFHGIEKKLVHVAKLAETPDAITCLVTAIGLLNKLLWKIAIHTTYGTVSPQCPLAMSPACISSLQRSSSLSVSVFFSTRFIRQRLTTIERTTLLYTGASL